MTHEAIIDVLWGDDEDGGPLYTRNIIAHYIGTLRQRHPGWVFQAWHGYGYSITRGGS